MEVALAGAVHEVDSVRLLVMYATGADGEVDTADVEDAEIIDEDDDDEYDGLAMPNWVLYWYCPVSSSMSWIPYPVVPGTRSVAGVQL